MVTHFSFFPARIFIISTCFIRTDDILCLCAVSTLQEVIKRQQEKADAAAAAVAAQATGTGNAEEEQHRTPEASASNANQEPLTDAPQDPPVEHRVEVDVSSDDGEALGSEVRASRKRSRTEAPPTERYTPDWVIYAHDTVLSKAPESARLLGGHICRGMLLPKDQVAAASVDSISACNELMAALSLVRFVSFNFFRFFGIYLPSVFI